MSLRRLRVGELLALAGAVCVIVALTLPWYETAAYVKLGAWATFGPAVALLMLSAAGALVLALATITERSTALPVAAAVWGVLLGFVVLRYLAERPEVSLVVFDSSVVRYEYGGPSRPTSEYAARNLPVMYFCRPGNASVKMKLDETEG